MKRMVLPVVVGFSLGIGGATGIVVAREREAQAEAASRAATGAEPDSLARTDSAAPPVALPAPMVPTPAALDDSPGLAVVEGSPDGAPRAAADSAAPAGPAARATLEGGKLAKLFGAMQPREAARVLEQMDDADVQAILASLGDRKAAAILASLPPQRAAEISRRAVHSGKVTQ